MASLVAQIRECPQVGTATGCRFLITIGPAQSVAVLVDPDNGLYDESDDILVAVRNVSGAPLFFLTLSGGDGELGLFDLDEDGACSGKFKPTPPGCTPRPDLTGYAGPGVSFSSFRTRRILNDTGTVKFTGGLANGTTRWFSLESNAKTPPEVDFACVAHPFHGHVSSGTAGAAHRHSHHPQAPGCRDHEMGPVPAASQFVAARSPGGILNHAAPGRPLELFGSAAGLYLEEADYRSALDFTPPPAPLYLTTGLPQVSIGGRPAPVLFSGLAPGLRGIWQINVLVPPDSVPADAPPDATVAVSYQGFSLGAVTVKVD